MISRIQLKNFRLFEEFQLTTSASLVILSGKNAVGKTSVLEAVYLCSTSKSHRSTDLSTLILTDKEYALCEVEADALYKVVLSKEGKALFINRSEIKKSSEFIGNLSVVLFSPYDLSLVQGAKGDKRRFLDLEISLLDKAYLQASALYKRLLKERNDVLKQPQYDRRYLDILTKDLCGYLEIIYQKRVGFLKSLNGYLKSITEAMRLEPITLEYQATYGEDIYSSFKQKEKQDILSKTTNIGAHRDSFGIYINGQDASVYASEGQIRTVCIALKLALKEYITAIRQEEPILLLDDVFAALDKTRIACLTEYVKRNKQTFITTTSILEIPDELLKNAQVIRIEGNKKGE